MEELCEGAVGFRKVVEDRAADEHEAEEACRVGHNGSVAKQPKGFGNPRHGYRCVRDLRPGGRRGYGQSWPG